VDSSCQNSQEFYACSVRRGTGSHAIIRPCHP
jgi:hypothetical protein